MLITTIKLLVLTFVPLTHGCPSGGATLDNTLEQDRFLDAGICPYADLITLPIFAAFVLVGVVNLPIYIRQDSIITPFVITMIIGGVMLTQVAGIIQTVVVVVILFTIGLGPVLVLRRVQAS